MSWAPKGADLVHVTWDGAPFCFPCRAGCWPQGPGQAAVDTDAFEKRPRPEGRAERPRGARV